MEFSVPASVENLELSVPTHLVLTFCKEKHEFCIEMQGKRLCVAQTVLNQNRENTSRKFGEQVEDKNRKIGFWLLLNTVVITQHKK